MAIGRTFAMLFLAMAGLFALDTFLAKVEQADKRADARRLYEEGERLARAGRNADAASRFRGALSIQREEPEYELALAEALLAAGNYKNAESAANDLLQHDPKSGVANLTMARVQVKLGNIADATSY